MHIVAPIFLFLSAVSISWASAIISPRVVHEKRASDLRGWTRSRKLPGDTILPLMFGLKQSNLHRLEEYLMDVSHPQSTNYGQHWNPQQVADAFAPSRDSVDAVKNWLQFEGISPERIRLTSSAWLKINATVSEIEQLLSTEYYVYSHMHGTEHIACDSYSVPSHLQEHIELILPGVNVDAKVRRRSIMEDIAHHPTSQIKMQEAMVTEHIPGSLSDCDKQITPDCLRALRGTGPVCINSAGKEDINGTRFNPDFPASCPWVTAVGATQINTGSTVYDPESACQRVIFSGGGFSDIFPMPQYQAEAVNHFFKNSPPSYSGDQYNNSRQARGYPDLSANGANYVVAVDNKFGLVFGTSASAPLVGTMITAINDKRLALGKKPVGFLNPVIYSTEARFAFNDITTGNNPGCGTKGFSAVPGWDPVTGVGTPNFERLLAYYLSLP